MKENQRRKQILKEMAGINSMEKGSLTEEYRDAYKDGKKVRLGPYHKYQRWESGRNVSRRLSANRAAELKEAVEGYHKFDKLAREYADITISMTRQTSGADHSKKKPRS
jgi:hypothetical protein